MGAIRGADFIRQVLKAIDPSGSIKNVRAVTIAADVQGAAFIGIECWAQEDGATVIAGMLADRIISPMVNAGAAEARRIDRLFEKDDGPDPDAVVEVPR